MSSAAGWPLMRSICRAAAAGSCGWIQMGPGKVVAVWALRRLESRIAPANAAAAACHGRNAGACRRFGGETIVCMAPIVAGGENGRCQEVSQIGGIQVMRAHKRGNLPVLVIMGRHDVTSA